jgi:hypothetical protein
MRPTQSATPCFLNGKTWSIVMSILSVGAGERFATISAAIAASHNGDTIQVQAGTYTNDTAKITTSITLQAVGGRVLMQETVPLANQKGILIIGTQTAAPTVSIDGFEFAGARTPYGNNGAGIRYQNGNLTLTNDYFHNNQDGVLATPWQPGTGTLLIDRSEFAYNGTGDGYTHNIYVGDIASFTLQNSYSHDTAEGHEVKSRAENTTIANNRIFDNGSTSSYSIDLPNGGNATITGNVIQQGANGHNPAIIAYGEEKGRHTGTDFTVSGNTFVHDLRSVTAVWNRGLGTANLVSNQFFGVPRGKVVSGANTETGDTFASTRPVLDTTTHPFSNRGTSSPPPAPVPNPTPTPVPTPTPSAQLNLAAIYDTAAHRVHITGDFANNSPVLLYAAANGKPVGYGTGTGFTTIQHASAPSFATNWGISVPGTYVVLAVENGVAERTTVTIGPAATPAVASAAASDPAPVKDTSLIHSPVVAPLLAATLNQDPSHLSSGVAGTADTLQLNAPDDQPINIGSGNNHLIGGSEFSLLFAGSGSDALSGSTNSDYLSASSGNDTLSGGAGTNFMQAGSGPGTTTFDLHMADAAKDIISGFRLGQDHLHVTDPTGAALAGSGIAALIGGATSDAGGSAVFHLSGQHDVTLSGIGVAKLGSGMFG